MAAGWQVVREAARAWQNWVMSEPAESSPHSFVPPRLRPAPSSGDGWVEDGTGSKFWGRFGAAGLLAHDPARGILLQHRANWSHFGGTWGLPGGARHEHETPVQGAVREASEEAGVVATALRLKLTSILDLGFWSYTTVVADVITAFDAVVTDAESIDVRWVPVDEVGDLPLHPGFAASWPALGEELLRRTVLIVDAANVVGSRPDGWWKDRLGATERLAARIDALTRAGLPAAALGLEPTNRHWWPETVLVVEGQARAARLPEAAPSGAALADAGSLGNVAAGVTDIAAHLTIIAAERDGDQAIVDAVQAVISSSSSPGIPLESADDARPDARPASSPATVGTSTTPGSPHRVFVVTADRELSARVTALGGTVLGPSWLLGLLEAP